MSALAAKFGFIGQRSPSGGQSADASCAGVTMLMQLGREGMAAVRLWRTENDHRRYAWNIDSVALDA